MSKHKDFFQKLFYEFDNNKLTYFVIKNYDSLPEASTRDVDLWVKKEDQKKALKILFNVAKGLGWRFLKKSIRMGFYKGGEHYFIDRDGKEVINIDISPFLHWKGLSYLDEEIFEEHILRHEKEFNIPSPGIQAAALIFRGAMMGKIKERDKAKIIECINRDSQTFLKVLKRPFGLKVAQQILSKAKDNKWDELEKNINYLHFVIFKRALLYRPLFQVRQWIFYYYERLKSHIFPIGAIFLVFFGPDGSGKTTTAKSLLNDNRIYRLFCRRDFFYRRFYISWFKKFFRFFKKKGFIDIDAKIDVNGEIKPLPRWKAIFYIVYLGIEYILGHYYIRRAKSNSALIVFDRYFYDYMIFKDFINCPKWLHILVLKLIPKPDLVIYLKNLPEVIHERKQEFVLDETIRQVKICESLLRYIPNVQIVETNPGVNEITEKIVRMVISKLSL